MPCLNEADTVGTCVSKAKCALREHGIQGEVVVADNGSTDGSPQIARNAGARVVNVTEKGYGRALMAGIAAAQGKYVLMGDADDSYDFGESPRFLEKLREGNDLVQGCRLPSGGGTIRNGAMPLSHRWCGNPGFSLLVRWWFHAPIHDVYCGMRAFSKECYERLNQRCTGMEFATEMIIKSVIMGWKLAEVPITLHPDGRKSHPPHLRTIRDGWRTLRFFLMYAPRWLFLEPGKVFVFFGFLGYLLALPELTVGGVRFGLNTLVFSSMSILCGAQAVFFAIGTKTFAVREGLHPPDVRIDRFFRRFTLERSLLLGSLALAAGAVLMAWTMHLWWAQHFGALDYAQTIPQVVSGATLTALGIQTIFNGFFISIIGLPRVRGRQTNDAAKINPTPLPKGSNGAKPPCQTMQSDAEIDGRGGDTDRPKTAAGRRSVARAIGNPGWVVSLALSLSLLVVAIRASVIGFGWFSLRTPSEFPRILAGAVYDLMYVWGITIPFVLLLAALPHQRLRLRITAGITYTLLAMLSLAAELANVRIVEVLGRPFNYRWFYYSDFLRSSDSHQAIQSVASWPLFLGAIGFAGGLLLLGLALWQVGRSLPRSLRQRPRAAMAVTLIALAVYIPLGRRYVISNHWSYGSMQNPVVCFVGSFLSAGWTPPLVSMKTPVGPEDFQPVANRPAEPSAAPAVSAGGAVQNVIVFVMESVPAEYIGAYGSPFPVTPELDRRRDHSAVFRNIYAQAPGTNYSMVSMLCSCYPWISFRSLTEERPEIALPSLSGEMKQHGCRTGFFYSTDLSFQSADHFLAHRGFDTVEDYHTRHCADKSFTSEQWHFLSGTDDTCTANSLMEWAGREPAKPFFAMLWTMQTHYPYFASGPEIDYGVKDEWQNRYLNALRRGDEALGKILRWLDERGLSQSTLVAVVADHGEAFGRHHQLTHANHLYEENVHVPLVLIHPGLFHGETYSTVGGLLDLAPTVLDLMRLPPPGTWQGHSLFSRHRSERVYFFAPWSDYQFGYRYGNRKYIYNATNDSHELFDLSSDPAEATNLGQSLAGAVAAGQQQLAAWVQFQDAFIRHALEKSPAAASDNRVTMHPR